MFNAEAEALASGREGFTSGSPLDYLPREERGQEHSLLSKVQPSFHRRMGWISQGL